MDGEKQHPFHPSTFGFWDVYARPAARAKGKEKEKKVERERRVIPLRGGVYTKFRSVHDGGRELLRHKYVTNEFSPGFSFVRTFSD